MTRFILVRHGETDWNVERRHQGQAYIPLNESGRRQAQAVADRLIGEPIDFIYASDLVRAWKTAEVISEFHPIPFDKEPRFREMSFGEWEGLTYDEIQERKQMTSDEWQQTMLKTGPPGGENLRQFAARIKLAIDEIISSHPDESVLIVAHGGTLMLLVCLLLGHPIGNYWQFRMNPASVSEISTFPEGSIFTLLNDTSHLKDVDDFA